MSELTIDTGEVIVNDVLKAENEHYLRSILKAQTARGKAKPKSSEGVMLTIVPVDSMVAPAGPGSATMVEIRQPIHEPSPEDLDPTTFKVTYFYRTNYSDVDRPQRENLFAYEPHRDSSIVPLEVFDPSLRRRFPHMGVSLDNALLLEINGDLKEAAERLEKQNLGAVAVDQLLTAA